MRHETSAKPQPTHLFDTSALVAYLVDEPEGRLVQQVRQHAVIPFIALTELLDVLWRRRGQALAEEAVEHILGWHLPVLVPDASLSLSAGQLKARYRLGIADSFMAAFALAKALTLVTRDRDFLPLQPDLRLLYLK